MSNVRVTEAESIDTLFTTPGAIRFRAEEPGGDPKGGFTFSCPCGCGGCWGVRLEGSGAWTWNGSVDKMTVNPSVDALNYDGSSHWHGWIKDGEWVRC